MATVSLEKIAASTPQPLPRRLRKILCLDDFEIAAQRYLPRPIFGFIAGAAETNASLDDNRAAFGEYGFVPRVLVSVTRRSTQRTLFGHTYSAPLGMAPMGLSALAAYRGDLALAEAAAHSNVPMIMSGSSLIRLEDLYQINPNAWFQAYLPGEPDRICALLDRVAQAGFETLVLTVDVSVMANRENNIRSGFSTPLKPSIRLAWDGTIRPGWVFNTFFRTLLKHGMPYFENSDAIRGAPVLSKNVMRDFGAKDHLNWEHFELIRKRWQGRLMIKGIMAKQDALIAKDQGADGIIVSNHGGRQLDGTVSPLRVLPDIADAIDGAIPVMMDSGIRRGGDVLKAIALGADFFFVGRPFLYAATIAGVPGVQHAVALLSEEVRRNMGMLGINTLDEMCPELLLRQRT